ncbi:hypothetical protein L6164_037352 [Bauhinia variegata]|uniref:Uncharacterized protein n=1 Tax=Bauhinia variegata TaxID=167791 RepID=A0ACB9KJV0_BAUVA|nr:hypothetical protein L6164_037352 [Bauhinia variegata]
MENPHNEGHRGNPNKPQVRFLMDYSIPRVNGCGTSITRPPVQANTFELKLALLQLVQQNQFGDHDSEDPNAHITNFLQICDTVKLNGPDLVQKFFTRYFPPSKSATLRTEITSFHQQEGESLSDAWERYNEILRRCPHHSFEFWIQVQSFYNGLLPHARSMVDAAAGGALNFKTPEQAWDLLEMMANNDYQRQGERVVVKKGIMEVDTLNALLAQNKIMTQQLANLSKKVEGLNISAVSLPSISCDFCGGNHSSGECPRNMFGQSSQEQLNYLGNPPRPQNDPFSNTYNLGWRNHPNISWGNKGNQGAPQRPPFSYQAPQQLFSPNVHSQPQSSEKNSFIGECSGKVINERPQGSLPSDTIPNPKEHVKAITTRSGKVIQPLPRKEINEESREKPCENFSSNEDASNESNNKQFLHGRESRQKSSFKGKKKVEIEEKPFTPSPLIKVPFPQRLKKQQDEKQFSKFLVFKKLHINIPFVEALEQMPSYAKFMKELLSKKRRIEDDERIMLTEECSAILQKKLPPNLKDLGSFSIPYTIGDMTFSKALCDFGASVSLMPLSIFKKLGIGQVKSTMVIL